MLRLDDNHLIIETGVAGKTKTTSKPFTDAAEAMRQFTKKEWELLKKGAVLRTTTASPGEPLLHLFIGGGYTGCLSFIATPLGIYVYRSQGNGGDMGNHDQLWHINDAGVVAEVVELPGLLPWTICYDPTADQLLLDLDHLIYTYDLSSGSFEQLTHQLNQPASFAAVSNGVRAYGTHPIYNFSSGEHTERIETAFDINIIRGSIPFCATLSADGKLLALHKQEGVIEIIDSADGTVLRTLPLSFDMADKLEWTNDNRQLMVQEKYGPMQLYCLDALTGEAVSYEGLTLPMYSQEVWDFCLNADQSLLVCLQRTTALVFDFPNKKFLYSFPVQHCVKTASIRFIDAGRLGVRTDYGCFSIYTL